MVDKRSPASDARRTPGRRPVSGVNPQANWADHPRDHVLKSHVDAASTAPTNGQVFKFDDTTGLWTPGAVAFSELSGTVTNHASRHTSVAQDPIDGDQLGISWNPSNSTPATTPTEVTSIDHLTAHLYGIDQELANVHNEDHANRHIQTGADPIAGDLLDLVRTAINYTADDSRLDKHLEGIDDELGPLIAASHAASHDMDSHSDVSDGVPDEAGTYLRATGSAWTTATIPAGDLPDHASRHQAGGADAVFPITSYVPAWTSTGTAPAIGNGTLVGSYQYFGGLIICYGLWAAGSTTTFGTGNYRISLPVAADTSTTTAVMGFSETQNAMLWDNNVSTRYGRRLQLVTSTTFSVRTVSAAGNTLAQWGATSPFTAAQNDRMQWCFIYKPA